MAKPTILLVSLLVLAGCASVTLPRVEAKRVRLQLTGEHSAGATVLVFDGDDHIDYTPDVHGRVDIQLPGRPQRTYALVLGVVPVWTSPRVMLEVWADGKRQRRLSQSQVLDLPTDAAGRRVLELP